MTAVSRIKITNRQSIIVSTVGSVMVEVAGFEPAAFWSRTKRATKLRYTSKNGANEGTRTPDLLITNRLLYQLSHIGVGFTVPAIT